MLRNYNKKMGDPRHTGFPDNLFLRCAFAAPDELRAHLRRGPEGESLLGIGLDGIDAAAPGTAAFVDVTFTETGERSLLRGSVAALEEDSLWLRLPQAHLSSSWMDRLGARRRRTPRFATDLLAEIGDEGSGAALCRVEDVSAGGLRVSCGSLLLPSRGESVRLTLLDRTGDDVEVAGRVAWASGRCVGLGIDDLPPRGYLALVAKAEARWLRAPIVRALPADPVSGRDPEPRAPEGDAALRRPSPEASASPTAG